MDKVKESAYRTVGRALRERISRGEVAQGEKFLTERQVAEQYKLSRPTANKILTGLVSEGLLEFRKGVGTFVNTGVLHYDLQRLVSFTDKARAAKRTSATRVLKFEMFKASAVAAEVQLRLGLLAEDACYYFERLRFADEVPVILERRHVPARWCPGLTAEALTGSLYALWIEKFGLSIRGAEQTIRAVNLDAGDAALLAVPAKSAALRVQAVGFLAGNEPLWHEQTTYRSDAYEFHTFLGGIESSRPAVGRFAGESERAR